MYVYAYIKQKAQQKAQQEAQPEGVASWRGQVAGAGWDCGRDACHDGFETKTYGAVVSPHLRGVLRLRLPRLPPWAVSRER